MMRARNLSTFALLSLSSLLVLASCRGRSDRAQAEAPPTQAATLTRVALQPGPTCQTACERSLQCEGKTDSADHSDDFCAARCGSFKDIASTRRLVDCNKLPECTAFEACVGTPELTSWNHTILERPSQSCSTWCDEVEACLENDAESGNESAQEESSFDCDERCRQPLSGAKCQEARDCDELLACLQSTPAVPAPSPTANEAALPCERFCQRVIQCSASEDATLAEEEMRELEAELAATTLECALQCEKSVELQGAQAVSSCMQSESCEAFSLCAEEL